MYGHITGGLKSQDRSRELAATRSPCMHLPRRYNALGTGAVCTIRGLEPMPYRPSRRTLRCTRTLLRFVPALSLLALGCGSTRDPRSAYLQLIRPDQKPSLVGARAASDSLYGDPRASLRGDGIAE